MNFSAEIQFGVISYTPNFFGHDKVGPENPHGLAVDYFIFYTLRNFFIKIMCFQPSFLLLHPPLFEVEPQCQKQQFSPYVLLFGRKESAETKIVLYKPKGSLHLNGSVSPKLDTSFAGNILQ